MQHRARTSASNQMRGSRAQEKVLIACPLCGLSTVPPPNEASHPDRGEHPSSFPCPPLSSPDASNTARELLFLRTGPCSTPVDP